MAQELKNNDNQFNKKKNFNTVNDLQHQLGKLPPQALDLEEAVLGALMLEKNALTTVIDILHPQSFYKDAHQKIYSAILRLFDKSEPVDILTVTQELRKKGELELAGGAFYITKLTSRVNSAANIEFHARIITECAIKRELISISGFVEKEAYEDQTDVFELLDTTEQKMYDVSERNMKKGVGEMSDIMRKALDELKEKSNQKDGLTGVPTGFSALDRVTSGWQKSDLVIIAARPGMGKTAFSLSAIRNAAVDFGKPVAFFSLEMSSVQLVNRLIASEVQLDSEKLRKGNLAPHEWQQLHSNINKLSEAKIFIDDTPALSVREFRTKARRLKLQHNIELIVVDYLQLMTGNDSSKGGNREQEIAYISRSLKGVAKELDVPVIALSQLSRSVETRGGDKRPQLSDLRESGSIEQDADIVMFLYRPEYYNITEISDSDGAPMPAQGLGEVIIAKHRNGSLDNVLLKFIGRYTKFTDLDGSFIPAGNLNSPSDTITLGSKMNNDENSEDFFGPSKSSGINPLDDDNTLPDPFSDEEDDDVPF